MKRAAVARRPVVDESALVLPGRSIGQRLPAVGQTRRGGIGNDAYHTQNGENAFGHLHDRALGHHRRDAQQLQQVIDEDHHQ